MRVPFRDRLTQVRLQARSLRRSIEELEAQTTATMERLGLQPPQRSGQKKPDDIVDVGARASRVPQLVKRGAAAIMTGVSVVLLGMAMLALGIFTGAAALAFLVITKGLGLRIDVAGARSA